MAGWPEWLPVPAGDDLPVQSMAFEPAEAPDRPMIGRIEFLVMGYTRPDGQVEVWATREPYSATIQYGSPSLRTWEYERSSFKAECGEWVRALGNSFTGAFSSIARDWGR
jgi:hypothetical protein